MKNTQTHLQYTQTHTFNLSSYLFGWVVRCCGSCGTCPLRRPSLPQCLSAFSWCLLPPGPRLCPIGCHRFSPGCTCPRQCWCSWSDWWHSSRPFACFSFWTQSRCQWSAGAIRRDGKKRDGEKKEEKREKGKKEKKMSKGLKGNQG